MTMAAIAAAIVGGLIVLIAFHVLNVLLMKPKLMREKLRKQGIDGPNPQIYFGNIFEIGRIRTQDAAEAESTTIIEQQHHRHSSISHRWTYSLFPHFHKWRTQYGDIFMYSSGTIQWLVITDVEMVKEVNLYTSLNLGKPSYLSKDRGPLLGQGILTSSGPIWAHQRKIIAPELYLDKVKAMVNLIVESTNIMVSTWEARLSSEGGVASEIKVDEDLRSLSADIIARACFGSNYAKGQEIFTKLRELQTVMSKIIVGLPGFRYLPTRSNREIWRLEKEINSMITKIVKQRLKEGHEQDLLQMILQGAIKYESGDGFSSSTISRDRFIIDNCKNIFFAGHETTAITASWSLMLLAEHQDWQDRCRAEVREVCGNSSTLDANMLRSMKMLNMVIQETLRLYPPATFVVRTALEDVRLKGLLIPKGMNIQIPIPILQQDHELWGPDAHKFNPQRFANGILEACKTPQSYIAFGVGPHVCAGQQLAIIELKVILCLILLKFQFSLSPNYHHSPAFRLVIMPGEGVPLLMRRI